VPPVAEEDILIEARGAWFTGDDLVRLTHDGLVSNDLATGAQNWHVPMDRGGGNCNASPTASEGRIAVLQGRDCEVLSVYDLAAGEEVVSFELDERRLPWKWDVPAILGDHVAVGWGTGGGVFGITAGEMVRESRQSATDCVETAYAAVDGVFLSRVQCGESLDEGGALRATTEDGRELWEWRYDAEYGGEPLDVGSVLSVDPLVVTAHVGEDVSGREHIFVIADDHQSVRHVLDYDAERYTQPCRINTLTDCPAGVVHDGWLYLASTVNARGENTVVAFDLSTGQAAYEVEPVSGGVIRPFGVADGRVLAYQQATDVLEGLVVAIDPATETAVPVMALDRDARQQERQLMGGLFVHDQIPLWHDGTLVLLNQVFYAEDTAAGRRAVLVYR
jgi:hypothetical protein